MTGLQVAWGQLSRRHRLADIVIFGTTVPQFMYPLLGNQTFGFNSGTMISICIAGLGVLASPFQLRWGHRQFMSRIFMLSGGSTRLMATFYPHNQPTTTVLVDAAPIALLLAGTVIYVKLLTDELYAAQMQSFHDRHKELKLDTPFKVINLFDKNVDLEELTCIAGQIDRLRFYPLLLHFRMRKIYRQQVDSFVKFDWEKAQEKCRHSAVGKPFMSYIQRKIDKENKVAICDPEEESDFSIVGCSLTGFDFLICGRYIDSEANRITYSKDLLMKLTQISVFGRHEIELRDIDLLGLNLERAGNSLSTFSELFSVQVQFEVRLLWDEHIARLDKMREDVRRMSKEEHLTENFH